MVLDKFGRYCNVHWRSCAEGDCDLPRTGLAAGLDIFDDRGAQFLIATVEMWSGERVTDQMEEM